MVMPSRQPIYLSFYAAGLSALAVSVSTLILPARALALAPEAQKNTYLGLLTFSVLAVAMVVQPLAGALSDRRGRRLPFIALGAFLVALLLPGLASPVGYGGLLGLAMGLAAAANLGQGPYQALITDLVPPAARGRAAALKVLADILGGAIFAALVGLLLGKAGSPAGGGWLWAAVGLPGAFLLAMAALTLGLVREGAAPRRDAGAGTAEATRATALDPVGRPAAWAFALFLVSRLLVVAALSVLGTYGYFYVRDVVGIPNPASVTGAIVATAAGAMLTVAYPTGMLADRFGARVPILLAGLVGLAGVLFLLEARGLGLLLGGAALLGAAAGAFLSANWGLAIRLVPPERAGFYLGLTNLATAGGAALVRLSGLGVDRLNAAGEDLGYRALLWACGACFVAGSLLVAPIEGRRRLGGPGSSVAGTPPADSR